MQENKNMIPENEPVAENGAVAVKKKPPFFQRFTVLVSLLVVLSLLTAAFAVFTLVDFDKEKDKGNGGNTENAFDYFGTDLSPYIVLTEDRIKGLNLPGYDSRVDAVTPENVRKYINQILLSSVGLTDDQISQKNYSDQVKWSEKIDYADDVFLYVISVDKKNEDGSYEPVSIPYFENSYMEPGHLQIGMAYFGESFDQALIDAELIPMETGYETHTSGTVDADDLILITYTATETVKATEEGKADSVKNHKNFQGQRLNLAEVKDTAWRNALLKSGAATVGQYFSFDYEEDVDGDGTKEKLKYEGVIEGIIYNERTKPIEATLPEGFFGKDPKDKTLASLNDGKTTLRFHISIDHAVPHDANTIDTLTVEDIETISAFLSEGGALPFTPSNASSLSDLADAKATLETAIKKLESEIQVLESREIVELTKEIDELEKALENIDPEESKDKKDEYDAKKKNLDLKKELLDKKTKELEDKKAQLEENTASLKKKEASLESALVEARKECEEFFTKELKDSYDETVKVTKGQVIYEYLVQNLTFLSLPESEVEAMEETAKQYVEYYYSQLTAAEKRNYRDIEAFAAAYFGYDEKDYDGYIHYIETYLAPYEIKNQLLLPAIYNTFINDESKLEAKINAHVADLVEIQAAAGQPMTREEILQNYAANAGEDYLRNYYAMPLVVYEFLAENNIVDFNRKN